jgi:hypothetical protein
LDEKKDGLKSFQLLSNGIDYIDGYLPKENKLIKKGTKTKTTNNDSHLLQYSLDELNIENYCELTQLEKADDQIYVFMYIYTKEKNIEYFSYEDILITLKIKFKINLKRRQVTYFFEKTGTKFDKKIESGKVYHKMMSLGEKEAEKIIDESKIN